MQRHLGRVVFFLGVLLFAPAARAELAVPPQEATVLLSHISIHSKNMTDEIAAINETVVQRSGAPFVVHPNVLRQMAILDPYVNGLIRTNLLAIPPRPRSPVWQPRPFEFMVSWRMADLFLGSERSQTALKNLVSAFESGANPAPAKADFDQSMLQLIQRYSIAVPATYIYIEALRRTYLINPCATWPNAELPAILARLEAQVFVLRQNMDALFINPFFNPCFPRSWGILESTFHGFRMNVAAPGPIGIAPFPYFREGAQGQAFFQPQVQAVPRQGLNPALPYNPNQFGSQWDRFSPGYTEANGVQPGNPGQSFPVAVPQPGVPSQGAAGGAQPQGGAIGAQPGLTDPAAIPQQGLQPQGNSVANGGQQGFGYGQNGQPIDQNGISNGQGPNGQPTQNPDVYGPQPQNQNYSGQQQPQQNQNYSGQQQPQQYQNYSGQQQPQQYQNYSGQQQPQQYQDYSGQPQNQNYSGSQQGGYNTQPLQNGNGSGPYQNSPQNNASGVNNADGMKWGWGDFGYANAQQQQQQQRQP
jgi:hypothetical protein